MTHAPLVERAPAKINLTLRILGRRADGYHELESLVAFAGVGDQLSLAPGPSLALEVSGPAGLAAGPVENNLVLKAARALAQACGGLKVGTFSLVKNLPVASGIGGGSTDAAAALRLLARLNGLPLDDARVVNAARATGADVPVCLDPRPRVMSGIGDILSDVLVLPRLPALLVNPNVPVATRDVFAALGAAPLKAELSGPALFAEIARAHTPDALLGCLHRGRNDLEAPAIALHPVIAEVLDALRATGCEFARMSGSGATCLGLYASTEAAASAQEMLAAGRAGWWVRATVL